MAVTFHPLGDTGIRVGFGERIDPETHRNVRAFAEALSQKPPRGVVEWVPTYCAVTVYYRPFEIKYGELCRYLEKIEAEKAHVAPSDDRVVVLPVAYGGSYGPDLADLCEIKGMEEQAFISLHTRSPYLVYMMGFVPGFPYLGGMPEELAAPRLAHPRPRIPAGSVGIAGSQTGVYPLETPGGWRIIGRTPVDLYDPRREQPVLLKAGDYLQFQPIDPDDFEQWRQDWLAGRLQLEQRLLGEGK